MTLDSRWQMSMGGLLLGNPTRYRFAAAPTGLGTPPPRTSDLAWLVNDGVYAAGDYLEAREVTAALVILGDSPAHAEALARALAGAWAPRRTDTDLLIRLEDGRTYTLTGRPRRCELDLTNLSRGVARAAVSFLATDPYLYGAGQNVVIGLGAGELPGIIPDISFDAQFQAPGFSPGVAYLSNEGTAPTYPTFTISGPVDTPRIENRTTSETTTIDLVLVGGDTLIIDCAKRMVYLNGTKVLGAFALGSEWVSLQPGSNEIAYRSDDSISPASTATAVWRPAWY